MAGGVRLVFAVTQNTSSKMLKRILKEEAEKVNGKICKDGLEQQRHNDTGEVQALAMYPNR